METIAPHLLALSLVVSLAVAEAKAQRPAPAVLPNVLPIGGTRLASVLVDRPGDGNVWVLAPGYKARFGGDGVDVIPYFGARAPRSWPLGLRLASVRCGARELCGSGTVAPTGAGTTVRYERAGVAEVWELRHDELEQTFVVAEYGRAADLVVTLAAATDMACVETPDGLRFLAPGLGELRVGAVTTLDAAGRRVTTAPRWENGHVELRVPAAFLEAASGPLRVDPVVRAVAVDTGNDDTLDPDVAYEPGSDRWLVVYTRVFSARDQDIIARRYSGDGTLLEELAVATGTRESLHPSVAASAATGQFLVAWDEDRTLDRIVLTRTRTAADTTMGPVFTAFDGASAENSSPRVGGVGGSDAFAGTFLVVCRETSSLGESVVAIRMSSAGTQGGALAITGVESSVDDPGVLKARQAGQPWLVTCSTPLGVRVLAVTAPLGPAVGILLPGSGGTRFPKVAGRNGQYLLAAQQTFTTTGADVVGFVLNLTGTSTLTLGISLNLTTLEPGAPVASAQAGPEISFDGVRYTYAYREAVGSGNTDVFAAAFALASGKTTFSEGHRALHATTTAPEGAVALAGAAEMGGDVARSFVVWERANGTEHDVVGALYDGVRSNGGVSTVVTRCGSVTFDLVAENTPALGASLRLRASPLIPASQVFLFGLPTAPIPLCAQGCKLGVAPLLFTFPGRALDLPIPTSLSVLGAVLATQNVLVANLGGCAPPTFPLALITTDTLVITVQ